MLPVRRKKNPWVRFFTGLVRLALALMLGAVSAVLTWNLIQTVIYGSGNPESTAKNAGSDAVIMDKFDMQMNNAVADALDGVLSIEKIYWLSDNDLIAPEPDQAKFGRTDDPSSLGWLLEEAKSVLGDQELVFHTEIDLHRNTEVIYYLDETIFAITWKQNYDGAVYTISEVKVAHPSQFRRFLAGGEYGSNKQYVTSDMAASVNAVVASSGDFYNFGSRKIGIVVYDGIVQRVNAKKMDSCMIDENGDLILVKGGQITDVETAQEFVDANNVRFSVCFGPILIKDGVRSEPESYPVGEVNEGYARAAICQKDELHYVLVTANGENGGYWNLPNIHTFTEFIDTFGLQQAYMLDGGQTACIVMNDEVINRVQFGTQRKISDIIYFATAIPNEE